MSKVCDHKNLHDASMNSDIKLGNDRCAYIYLICHDCGVKLQGMVRVDKELMENNT